MSKSVIVIGAGSWGGWTAFKLQEAGFQVTLYDKEGPGNTRAGSGGKTRIIRMAYGGDQGYTDLVNEAFVQWEKYALKWQETLYHPKGALWMFRGVTPNYAEQSIPLMEKLGYPLMPVEIAHLKTQYPLIAFDDITAAYWEPKVWYLEAARSCAVVVEQFKKLGGVYVQAEVEQVSDVGAITIEGQKISADHVVVACGPWASHGAST